jgi:uncharacterized protein (DUF433 family)
MVKLVDAHKGIYRASEIGYDLRMNWKDYIVADSAVLGGKPTIKGTRISVEFIIQRLAQGWTEGELLENYPRLTPTHLQAVFAYIQECIADGLLINYSSKTDR